MTKNWLDEILDLLLKKQATAVTQIPLSLKLEGRGRKGCLVIEGEPRVRKYFRWTGQTLVEDNSPDGVEHTITMHVDTLLDVASGELSARTAVAAGMIRLVGSRSLYHREEILHIVETLGDWIEKQLRLMRR